MLGTQYNSVQSIRDTVVWEPTLFSKIPSQNPNIEKGNRLEVATEIALRRCGMEYENLTGWYHRGNIADFETPTLLIECKNWFTDHYRITVDKVRTQILPRFTHTDDKRKVLIISKNSKWDSAALRLVRRNNIHIIEVPRVRTDSDILYVADRIKEALSRVCRIDGNTNHNHINCIHPEPVESLSKVFNRIRRPIIRLYNQISNVKGSHDGQLARDIGQYCLERRLVRLVRRFTVCYDYILRSKYASFYSSTPKLDMSTGRGHTFDSSGIQCSFSISNSI